MNPFQEVYDKQKAYFDSDATKSYEWRIGQLTRLENLLKENAQALEDAISSDFKTASQEKVFEVQAPLATAAFAKADLKEWMKPVDVVVPKALAASGHTAKVYREPYGVTLVIGPFNGPLTLLFDPAVNVLAAGNPSFSRSLRACRPQVNSCWISCQNTSTLGPLLRSREARKRLRNFSSYRLTSSSSPGASR